MPPKATPRRSSSSNTPKVLRTGAPALPLAAVPAQAGAGAVKVHNWGEGNQQPQELLRAAYDSGTAEACLRILAQFIGGKGFAAPATALARANPSQTFNELLAEAKHYAALGIGVGLALRFDYSGQNPDIYVIGVDCVRRERDGSGRYVFNDRLAVGRMPIQDNRLYLPYHPTASPEELAAEVLEAAEHPAGYWGHLWWRFEKRVGRNRYPVPHWYAGKEDVEADAQLPRYDLKQLKNGFMPDAILTLIGEKYEDIEDSSWSPGPDQTEDDRPFVKSPARIGAENAIRDLKGAATTSSVMLVTGQSKDELPQIDWVDKGPNSKGLTDMSQRIEGRVYRRFGVPPVLDGVEQPGKLGTNQQIVNSIKLFNLVVEPSRALITESLAHLRPDLDFAVVALNPVDYIDPAVTAVMTPDELRALQGLPPLSPAFAIGERVQVRAGMEHHMGGMSMGGAGTVKLIDGTAYGILLDSMPDQVHKWYVAEELEPEGAGGKPAPKPTPTPKI